MADFLGSLLGSMAGPPRASEKEIAQEEVNVRGEDLWNQVRSVGGDTGWHAFNWLWRIRGLLDRLLGGIGMRRGRRHPTAIRVGDAIDFWRVIAVDPGKRLTLMAEMKLPGSAILEFTVEELQKGSRLTTTAYFHPAGVLGILYWYILAPIHPLIFKGMTRSLARKAVQKFESSVS